ncbi:MAG TPA: F0F1 ATP synthase subunit B [Planctomycetota bacterium]|nr:F0F1 ATP synthase subunit B [Planctomycetota bacterium]
MLYTFDAASLALVPMQAPAPAVERSTTEAGHDAGPSKFNPLEPSFGLTFWSGLTYILLLVLLAKFAWGPITRMVEEREKRIRGDLDGAERARAEADQALAQYRRQLDEAALRAKETLEEAREKAEKAGAEILARSRAEADALLEKAKRQIEGERDKALAEVKTAAVELALEITRTVVKRTASQEDLARTAEEVLPRFKTVA